MAKKDTVIRVWDNGVKVQVGGKIKFSSNKEAAFPDTQEGEEYTVYVKGTNRGTVRGGHTKTITRE